MFYWLSILPEVVGDMILILNIINLGIGYKVPMPLHSLVDRQLEVAPEYQTKHLANDC